MFRFNSQINHARLLCGLALALVGLVVGIAIPLASITAASAKQSDSGLISSGSSQENPLSLNRWSSNGPDGGEVLSLAIDPSNSATIYAGTAAGVFKSTDAGGSWRSSLTNAYIKRIVVCAPNPNTVYAGGGDSYKSTDGGLSWTRIGFGGGSFAVDPTDPNIVYAGVFETVFKSTDGGSTWNVGNTHLFNLRRWQLIRPTQT